VRRLLGVAVAVLALAVGPAACGDDGGAGTTGTTAGTTSSTGDSTTTTGEAATSTPALWPAPGTVIDDPSAAAAGFLAEYVPGATRVQLGGFQAGDQRSGEIPVFGASESGGRGPLRSTLLLRQLDGDGWFVLAAVSEGMAIESPANGALVGAGSVAVQGRGRGFEATILVTARVAGTDGSAEPLDRQIAAGGSAEALEPFDASLDLSSAPAGSVVGIVAAGDTGLDGDSGEFAAVAVAVGS
jgi:hypothetical protein